MVKVPQIQRKKNDFGGKSTAWKVFSAHDKSSG